MPEPAPELPPEVAAVLSDDLVEEMRLLGEMPDKFVSVTQAFLTERSHLGQRRSSVASSLASGAAPKHRST